MDIHQTQAYAHYLARIGWFVEKHPHFNCQVFIKKLPLLPLSIMKIQRVPLQLVDWEWIEGLEKKFSVYETVLELCAGENTTLLPSSFQPAVDFMLNTKTLVIRLNQNETTLLNAMKPKTRYNIRLAGKRGLQTKIWSTYEVAASNTLFEQVYSVLRDNARRTGMWLIPKQWIRTQYKAFGTNGFVAGIYHGNNLMAVATYFCSSDTCSYNLNGSTHLGRKYMAPSLAVWIGIKEARRRKLSTFDFDGLFDERYPKSQRRFRGYGNFKQGFGGETICYPSMYRKIRWPWQWS